MVLLAVSSMSVDQQCTLNKVSLNRNTQETRLCIDQVTRRSQELNLVFLPGAVFQLSLTQCLGRLSR